MPHGAPFITFEYKSGYREFAHMIGCVLIADSESLRNFIYRQFRLTVQQVQYLEPPMICESFDDPLDLSVCAL